MIVASANGSVTTNIVVNDSTDQQEDDQESTLEPDVDGSNGSSEDNMDEEDSVENDLDNDSDASESNNEGDGTVPQTSIDVMLKFLADNSADNPLIIPAGSSFIEVINTLDLGEGVRVSPALTLTDTNELHGALALVLNSQIYEDGEYTFDAEHWFYEVVIFLQYEDSDEDSDGSDTPAGIPQASIDKMEDFIENNSADNPLVIPSGLNFSEAINALDWGEGITVWSLMSGHGLDPGQMWGSIFLHLNQQISEDEITYDAEYGFEDIGIYYELEYSSENLPTIPQASIELMRSFLENNSSDNPLTIPTSLTFNETLNALNWGEGVSVWAPMTGLGTGQVCGSIILHLNRTVEDGEVTSDDEYGFWDVCIYYEFEAAQGNNSQNNDSNTEPQITEPQRPANPILPQTGVRLVNASLIGVGVLAVCGGLIYLRNKGKSKD